MFFFSYRVILFWEKERKAQGLAFGLQLSIRIPFAAAAAFYR
jgi:hypothetical protein